jgi:hypothetical protein
MNSREIRVGGLSRPATRVTAVCGALAATLIAVFLAGPRLHTLTNAGYADNRPFLGVPNLLNVASNLAFLLVGAAGLALCAGGGSPRPRASWAAFYAGLLLTSLGSAWYHLAPSDATIVWDRLGMTVAFVALFVAVLQQSTGISLQRYVLIPALGAGTASVLWWRATGDLRPYAWVQAAPLAGVVLSVACGWVTAPLRRALAWSLVLYVLAKVTEASDERIFRLTAELISGHTLKHLLAAACAAVILAAQYRDPAGVGGATAESNALRGM